MVFSRNRLSVWTEARIWVWLLKPASILTQMTTVGLLQNDILRCSWFEAEGTSNQACAQGTFLNTAHTLLPIKLNITLHSKSRPTPHATSPQIEFSNSCSIKVSARSKITTYPWGTKWLYTDNAKKAYENRHDALSIPFMSFIFCCLNLKKIHAKCANNCK